MSNLGLELALTKNFLTKHSKLRPKVAIVLGSGLGGVVNWIDAETSLDYRSIPNFPKTGVPGHAGKLIFGRTPSRRAVLLFAGRAHYFEGLSMRQVAYPAYVAHSLGVTTLIVTNAAGGLNEEFAPGDLMLVRDHINLMGDGPLRGPEIARMGTRFVSMLDAYDPQLFDLAMDVAKKAGIKLHQGVYAALGGPAFETEAELRMLYRLGADAVGMSTVPEVIAARQAGLRVLGLSTIANDAFPLRRHRPASVDHHAVLSAVEQSVPAVQKLLEGVIEAAAL